ncbi:thiopeptide-type bacteriocin biosynthesis protein [Glycomyces salinus]|uniref:thiopeptide-type bacteriocin biosynthesis protein n=1 Tax=Glycomyces salinus TaxID=980294 RepID=UPI0018EDC1C1|nr:thiopeptide-type bacteriocin biosynthesis protein [Glycomyces salinus]
MTAWHQVNLHLASTAETVLTDRILPIFTAAAAPWFFIRKHPFRIRWAPPDPATQPEAIHATLDGLVPETITAWNPAIYEPETHAFGGPEAIAAAHDFFHAESRHLATALTESDFTASRATYSTLLAAHLMRAAGLDWWEQGDIWARITSMRTTTTEPNQAWRTRLAALLTRDPWQQPNPRLEPHRSWFDATAKLGSSLAELTASGRTTRGLRALIAHHLIFHWNRTGIPTKQQAHLAAAARTIYFGTPEEARP